MPAEAVDAVARHQEQRQSDPGPPEPAVRSGRNRVLRTGDPQPQDVGAQRHEDAPGRGGEGDGRTFFGVPRSTPLGPDPRQDCADSYEDEVNGEGGDRDDGEAL